MLTKERVEGIVQRAEEAFWASVARDCPEIKTGDFDPLDTVMMKELMHKWIARWYYLNKGQR